MIYIRFKVGDIIKVSKDDIFPADIVILDSSLTKNKENVCYADTHRVDGINEYTEKKAASLTKCNNFRVKNLNFNLF